MTDRRRYHCVRCLRQIDASGYCVACDGMPWSDRLLMVGVFVMILAAGVLTSSCPGAS